MKKIFTMLGLLLCAVVGASAQEVHSIAFNGGKNVFGSEADASYFTWNTAKHNFNAKFKDAEYDGVSYSNGLKMEGATSISWTSTAKSNVIIVQSTWSDKTIKFDGTELSIDGAEAATGCRVYTITDVEAGDHSVTRGSGESGLFLIKVTYTEESTAPELGVSPKSLSFDLIPLALEKTATFTITGKNLTDGTYDLTVPNVEGLTVAPTSFTVTDGAVSQEFTVTYASAVDVEAASGIISATVGENTVEVTVNYSCRSTAYTQTTVSEATTWNWEKLTAEVELSDATTPTNKETFVFANIEGVKGLAFNNDFTLEQARQIKMINTQFPSRNKKFQNGTISFTTTVPGTVVVDFSDTGSSVSATATPRYLLINGMYTQYWTSRPTEGSTKSNDRKTTEAIAVPAGEVVISSTQAVCIYSIKFTPAEAPASVTAKITDAGFATFTSQFAVTLPEGIEAYYASAAADGKVTLSKIEGNTLPAATPVVLKGNAGEHQLTVATSTEQLAATNLLKGTIGECTPADEAYYTLAAGPVFKKSSGGKLAAGKAYLVVPASKASELTISFDSEVTGISEVKGASQQSAAIYSISGQRVAQPTKGLYIQNGKKVILK